MRIGFRDIHGVQIRFAVSDSPVSPRLVLTSPWPESLWAFQRVWSRLSSAAHVLAIDLPGVGRSQSRTELRSPRTMGEFLVRLLDEWAIDQPHLVCPGIGTSAALYAAAHHPERMRSLVVGSGAIAYPLVVGGILQELIEAPNREPARRRNPREVVAAMAAAMGTAAAEADVVEDFIESTTGDRIAEASRYLRSYPEELQRLGELLPTIFTPVQVVAGRWDPLVPLANAHYLEARLPNSRLDVLDTGHFAWDEAPEQYAAIVTAWVNGVYLTGRAGYQW